MRLSRFILAIAILSLIVSAGWAQSGGQVCVKSFEDRNANGILDIGEPLITTGITANLINETGIIINTQTLDDSPIAAQGFICFQNLAAGQYSISVTSSSHTPTTSNMFTTVVMESGIPPVFDFGAQVIVSDPAIQTASTVSDANSRAQLEGLFFGLIGAAIAMGAMAVIGVIVYALVFGKRLRELHQPAQQWNMPQAGPYSTPTPSGTMPPVQQPNNPDPYQPPAP